MHKTLKRQNLNDVINIFQKYERQIIGNGCQVMEFICEYDDNKHLGHLKATFEVPLLTNEFVDINRAGKE